MTEIPIRAPGVLGDRYEIQDLIGSGGMADVYRARDRILDRDVAVKLLRNLSGTETERARFADEARTLARLSHPGLVTILDAATTTDQPYLVMELVRGPSLAECCQGIALEPRRVAAIGAQLAEALGYAHSCGIVHRDLKPSNVLLGEDNRALLTDFGIARLMSDAARHTATGVLIGTAAYLAPEQVRGQQVSPATDVYSLGLVLLEALTGNRAYDQGTPTEVALARLTSPPAIPAELPRAWQALLRTMTAPEPEHRPPTDQVAASLRRLAAEVDPAAATGTLRTGPRLTQPMATPITRHDDRPVNASTTMSTNPGTARLRQPGRAWQWRWIAALGVLMLLSAVGIVAVFVGGKDNPDPALPTGVPPNLEQPLRDLHDAVEGR